MYFVRLIQPEDDLQIATIIRQVSQEFGLAAESGFAVGDALLDELSQVYQ
jgi:putative acetyltransferase